MARRHERQVPDGLILALVCVAQFMVVLDVSIVNVALPSMGRELHYSATGLQWVVNAYVLTFAGFLLLGGRAADLFGRRRVFIAGLTLFSVASLLGGLAQTSGELTAARALQGTGAAILSPATLTIIMTTFTDGVRRNRALGMWGGVSGAGGASGALLGGVLTSSLSWRWVLFVNVPIGAAAIAASFVFLSESRRPDAQRNLDVAGAVTVTGGLAILVYAIVGTDKHPWGSTRTLGLLAVAAVLLGLFFLIEARLAKAPLMPLSLFRSRSVAMANVVMFLVGVVFFSMWYFLTLYLQQVHGYSPIKAGLLFFPMGVVIIAGAQISSRLVTSIGSGRVLIVALSLTAGGFLWLSQLGATTSYLGGVFGGGIITSFGAGMTFTPLAAAATSGVPMHLAGLTSGVLNTSRQVGGSLGLAALATLATDRTHDVIRVAGHVTRATSGTALTDGFDRAFLVAAFVTIVAAIAATFLPREPRRPRAVARTELGTPTPAVLE